MDIHQCLTCGERWGWGTQAAERRVQKHAGMGHQVVVGDETALARQCAERGIAVVYPHAERGADVMPIYRCMTCGWQRIHDGTEAGYKEQIEHGELGHRILIGEAQQLEALALDPPELVAQTANPSDPESRSNTGGVTFFGEGERTA